MHGIMNILWMTYLDVRVNGGFAATTTLGEFHAHD